MRRQLGLLTACVAVGTGLVGCSSDGSRGVSAHESSAPRRQQASVSPEAAKIVADARSAFRWTGREAVRSHLKRPSFGSRSALPNADIEGFVLDAGRLVPKQRAKARVHVDASLPRTADAPVEIREVSSAFSTRIALSGAGAVQAEIADGYAVYPKAYKGQADILTRPSAEGVEDFVLFPREPEDRELRYTVTLGSSIVSVRLVANTVELLDKAGTPRLRMQAPWAVDRAGKMVKVAVAVPDCAVDRDARAPWGRTVVAAGRSTCTVQLSWGKDATYPLLVDPSWTSSGSMAATHYQGAADLLADGRVLVAGGYDVNYVSQTAAELYDPATKTWATTGSLTAARTWPTASRLPNGNVLFAGGEDESYLSLASAEVYDPANGTFAATGTMASARETHAAVTLADGRVAVFGGYQGTDTTYGSIAGVEIFDPTSGAWSAAASMSASRTDHTAVRLPDGRVFVAGGYDYTANVGQSSAEVYDPGTNQWSSAGSMSGIREMHTASVLSDGRVLVAGGDVGDNVGVASTELYDPAGNSWSAGPSMNGARTGHTATALPGNRIMFNGGYASNAVVGTPEVFAESDSHFAPQPAGGGRFGHFALALADTRVVLGGGQSTNAYLTDSEMSLQGEASTDKTSYTTGENVVVTYAGLPGTGNDWLAVAPEGSQLGTTSAFAYLSAANGTHSFAGTFGPGTYRVRMFFNNGYTEIGESATTFTVAGAAATVTTDSASYTVNDPVVVSWTGLAGTGTDWISLATAGSSDYSFIRWVYTGGAVNGQTTFAALQPGTYVARSYNNNSYAKVAESATFTVGGGSTTTVGNDGSSYTTAQSVTVTYGGMLGSATDWISIAPQGSPASTFAAYRYTGGATSGSVSIPLAGLTPGTYVTRAYFADGYTVQAESTPFTLTP